jgi:hypothetical protein
MKVNAKATAKTVLILISFTILPLLAQQLVPSEFFNAFTMQGFDIVALSNKIALIGLAVAVLVLLRGHVEKPSSGYLALSTVWKFLWLFIVFFALGLGHPETLGLAMMSSTSEHVENSVTFSFRLFAGLTTAIVALMVAKSIIEFRETKPPATVQESKTKPPESAV